MIGLFISTAHPLLWVGSVELGVVSRRQLQDYAGRFELGGNSGTFLQNQLRFHRTVYLVTATEMVWSIFARP